MTSPLASQAKTKLIGDCAYTVEPLGFIDGRKAFVRLGNLLAPALTALETKKPKDDTEAGSVFFNALGSLLERLNDADLEYFQGLYAKRTTVKLPDGREPVLADILDTHFTGKRFIDYFAWLGFAIWSTYGDFFTDALTKASDLPSALGKAKA